MNKYRTKLWQQRLRNFRFNQINSRNLSLFIFSFLIVLIVLPILIGSWFLSSYTNFTTHESDAPIQFNPEVGIVSQCNSWYREYHGQAEVVLDGVDAGVDVAKIVFQCESLGLDVRVLGDAEPSYSLGQYYTAGLNFFPILLEVKLAPRR